MPSKVKPQGIFLQCLGYTATMPDLQNIVDLTRYPVHAEESSRVTTFAADCRRIYRQRGVLLLADFLTPGGLDRMAAEAREAAPKSFRQQKQHNVYLCEEDPGLAADHPRNRRLVTSNSTVADCDIPAAAALRRLYDSAAMRRFFATVTGKTGLYPYTDPLSPLNLGVTREGETLAWHFDRSDFAITLLLQAALGGGCFEYVPGIRNAEQDNYPAIEQLLNGEHAAVQTLDMRAGTLVLFQGRYSIHRVTEVQGPRERLLAVLSYDERPGQRMAAYTQKTFYGRAA